uniref:Uncharacterized protein n=1 Tax=Ananas comosus var. bracteatus TaxID=296719 RepID=A0A6V7QCM6_ANACO|nr:unnamed protein product [Ananas comosus var. bracteatus]
MYKICKQKPLSFQLSGYFYRELSRFIAAGKLPCKINKVADILETNRPDARNAFYWATIKQGDFFCPLNLIWRDPPSAPELLFVLPHRRRPRCSTTERPRASIKLLFGNLCVTKAVASSPEASRPPTPMTPAPKPPASPKTTSTHDVKFVGPCARGHRSETARAEAARLEAVSPEATMILAGFGCAPPLPLRSPFRDHDAIISGHKETLWQNHHVFDEMPK